MTILVYVIAKNETLKIWVYHPTDAYIHMASTKY